MTGPSFLYGLSQHLLASPPCKFNLPKFAELHSLFPGTAEIILDARNDILFVSHLPLLCTKMDKLDTNKSSKKHNRPCGRLCVSWLSFEFQSVFRKLQLRGTGRRFLEAYQTVRQKKSRGPVTKQMDFLERSTKPFLRRW